MIDSDIQASLCDAGIRKDYHNKTLGADYGRVGRGAVDWLVENGSKVKADGLSVLFTGVGTTEIITMMAKAMHLRGTSVRIYPLFKFRSYYRDPIMREDIQDADCLVILGAQDHARCNPLHDSVAAEVEYLVRSRREDVKATFIQAATNAQISEDMENSYWTSEFWRFVLYRFDELSLDDLKGRVSK